MAQINDRKSNAYSQKQSIRDELSAPQYLESAGDQLIKELAKKQISTSTSLQEQLQIQQNFEKGAQLIPDNQKGILSLEKYKKHVSDTEPSTSLSKQNDIPNIDDLMKLTGLTRHELELSLSEKPNSTVSQLYMFAVKNKKLQNRHGDSSYKLLDHPINRLKEIEEEHFGHLKKCKRKLDEESEKNQGKPRKKKKHRKRKKKSGEKFIDGASKPSFESESLKNSEDEEKEETPDASTPRVSLWDVKDMKKWSESKEIGCKPQAFYTIKNGKIIKLEKKSGSEDLTSGEK